ncbi:MAG: ribose-phosphate pyrophosphokinase [Patescibacteria group bacterium]
MEGKIVVCGGRSNPALVQKVCSYLSITPTPIETVDFSNGNTKVIVAGDVRSADVFVIQTGARGGIDNRFFTHLSDAKQAAVFEAWRRALKQFRGEQRLFGRATLDAIEQHFSDLSSLLCNRDFVELLMIIDALKTSSAGRITVVMPYMFYVRSDKKEESRISVTARMVADLLREVGADRVLVMDLHAPQIREYFHPMPTDQIFAESLFFEFIRLKQLKNIVVVSADEGNLKPSIKAAKLLKTDLVIVHKQRHDDSETADVWSVTGQTGVEGKTCLVFDDELLTFGTLNDAIKALFDLGAAAVYGFIVHFIASNKAIELIKRSPISALVTTNTVSFNGRLPKKVQVCDVAPILARIIHNIHADESASTLIDQLRTWSLSSGLPFDIY